jgi:hypothetical protein
VVVGEKVAWKYQPFDWKCGAVQGGDAMKALFKMFFHLYIYNTGL